MKHRDDINIFNDWSSEKPYDARPTSIQSAAQAAAPAEKNCPQTVDEVLEQLVAYFEKDSELIDSAQARAVFEAHRPQFEAVVRGLFETERAIRELMARGANEDIVALDVRTLFWPLFKARVQEIQRIVSMGT